MGSFLHIRAPRPGDLEIFAAIRIISGVAGVGEAGSGERQPFQMVLSNEMRLMR